MTTTLVRPNQTGTFAFSSALGARYTIGREEAARAALRLVQHTPELAVDIETEGIGAAAMRMKAVTVGSAEHGAVLDPRDPAQADVVRRVLADAETLVLHNSPFDVPVLVRNGLMRLEDIRKVVDTLIYCRLAEPDERTSKALRAAGARYLDTESTDELVEAFKALGLNKTEGYRRFDLDRPIYVQGAAIDVIVTARVLPLARQAALARLTNHPFGSYGVNGAEALELLDREQVVNRIFLRRAAVGMRADLDYLDGYRASVVRQQDEDFAVLDSAGVKAGNGGSLTGWLDALGLLPAGYPRTEKTKAPSAQADHLARLKHPVAQAFVRLKESTKVDKDYLAKVVDSADDAGRIHPTTTILGAATGRMSMSDPPLHQFPEDARGIILPDEGDRFTSIDWKSVEPVVGANMARDEAALADYENGGDLYDPIAALAGITRSEAKVVVLAQMYGEGMDKLAADLGVTKDKAWSIRRAVFRAMPRTDQLIRKLRKLGERHQLIFTMSGRIVPIPVGKYGIAVHKAVNYFVQGSAYDVLAESLIAIEAAGLSEAVYLAMHDELVVSTAAADEIERIMQTPPERLCRFAKRIPVLRTDRADIGERWAKV